MDDHAELMRVRDRLHEFINNISGRLMQIELTLGKLDVRVDELEEARDQYVPVINQLVQANAIAVALTEQLKGDRTVTFARWQIAVGVLALATPYVLFGLAIAFKVA